MTSLYEKKGAIIRQGFHDGIPIALGYYAVAFSLGIIARKAEVGTLTDNGFARTKLFAPFVVLWRV